MPQVVDSSNLIEFTQTGKVAEFKAPEGAAPAPSASSPTGEGKQPEASQQARSADGKFTAATAGDKTTPAADKAPKSAEAGEDDLSEVVRQKINNQHRLRKEAEERERKETLRAIKAEERAELLQRQLEAGNSKSGSAAEQTAPKEPKPEDFNNVQEYTDALVTYRVDQRLREKEANAAREAEQRGKAAREQEFGKRLQETRGKHDDFDSVLGSIKGSSLDRAPQDVIEYIQESDHGGELLYHLAKNPDVLERLQKLSPRRFIAELGKLETKWDKPTPGGAKEETPTTLTGAAATPAKSPVSNAPAPIAPLDTAGIAPVAKKPEDMNASELREFRRNQDRQKRAAGR